MDWWGWKKKHDSAFKRMDNLYITVCLKNKAWSFSRPLKISIRRQIQMTRGRYEDYWLPGALCRFFLQKSGQNFRSSTPKLWKCNDICSTAHHKHGIYNNLYSIAGGWHGSSAMAPKDYCRSVFSTWWVLRDISISYLLLCNAFWPHDVANPLLLLTKLEMSWKQLLLWAGHA